MSGQVDDGHCATYIGPKGAGNYFKMEHNRCVYGDMQIIIEVYEVP